MSEKILDEAEKDNSVPLVQYRITSFGADYDVEGIVRRLDRDDIFIPPFQRAYVWKLPEASRFIESLLLGLPVPGVFLAKDDESKRLLVIDGQQRLKSLQFFKNGYFNPREDTKTRRIFRLTRVQQELEGKTYDELSEEYKRTLNDSIIHATIVQQDQPENDDTSIYHIFERLNTSGRKLSPQQIRVAIYQGAFINMLIDLNTDSSWRAIFGRPSATLKDQELILRFLAFYFNGQNYSRPMNEFLNKFTKAHRNFSGADRDIFSSLFTTTVNFVHENLGGIAFRPERALNAAVFDSVMTVLAEKLEKSPKLSGKAFSQAYFELIKNKDFRKTYLEGTADEANVSERLRIAHSYIDFI